MITITWNCSQVSLEMNIWYRSTYFTSFGI